MLKQLFFKRQYVLSNKSGDVLNVKEDFGGGVTLYWKGTKIVSVSRKEVNRGFETLLSPGKKVGIKKKNTLWGTQYLIEVNGRPAKDSIDQLQGKLELVSSLIFLMGMVSMFLSLLKSGSRLPTGSLINLILGGVLVYCSYLIKKEPQKIIKFVAVLLGLALASDVLGFIIFFRYLYSSVFYILVGLLFKAAVIYELYSIWKRYFSDRVRRSKYYVDQTK